MSSSLFTILSLAWIVLVYAEIPVETSRPVLIRLYADFAHIYRPIYRKSFEEYGSHDDRSVDYYNISFSTSEYAQISEESLGMLNAKVLERTIVHYPEPNFRFVGSRYLYRRHPQQDDAVEIELVNPVDRLFREVLEPNRYFYLSTFDNLQYLGRTPVTPYYDVIFKCQRETLQKTDQDLASVTYHDRSFGWSARYVLNVPSLGTNKKVPLLAYADIRNRGDHPLLIKRAELGAGDVKLLDKSDRGVRSSPQNVAFAVMHESSNARSGSSDYRAISLGEQGSGIYFYEIPSLLDSILPPQSVRSAPLVETNMTTKSFVLYASSFSNSNGQGKLIRAYNLSSTEAFLPTGRWIIREQGQLLGEFELPALARSEVYTMKFGADPDIIYQRQVSILERNEVNETITYQVQYSFVNGKDYRDVQIEFRESFTYEPYFEMKNISSPPQSVVPLYMFGSELRGEFVLPRNQGESSFTYQVIIYQRNPLKQRQ